MSPHAQQSEYIFRNYSQPYANKKQQAHAAAVWYGSSEEEKQDPYQELGSQSQNHYKPSFNAMQTTDTGPLLLKELILEIKRMYMLTYSFQFDGVCQRARADR